MAPVISFPGSLIINMVKGQVSSIKTMMNGDVRISIDIDTQAVPKDIVAWRFEDVVIVTKGDIEGQPDMGGELGQVFNEKAY